MTRSLKLAAFRDSAAERNVCVGISLLLILSACTGSDAEGVGPEAGTNTGGTEATTIPPAGGSAAAGGGAQAGSPATGGVTAGETASAGATSPAAGTVSASGTANTRSTGGSVTTGGMALVGGSSAAGGTMTTGGSSATGGTMSIAGSKSAAGSLSTGGSRAAGATVGTGGSNPTGGTTNAGGSRATGGSVSTGGAAGAGGSTGSNTGCPGADASEFALVQAWLNNATAPGALPNYAYSNIKKNFPAGAAFDRLACSIAMSCAEFAPMETDWLRKCEAVITSAIVAESSYNPLSVVTDTYATRAVTGGTANDPTVGLLQVRFSSTMHDYNYNGPMAKMAAIGCTWPPELQTQADTTLFWAAEGGTTYLSFMQDVACNIGSAAWYYFYNATGNGGTSAVWISNYCKGQGIAGTMVTGLLSHLQGGNYPRPADATNPYPWGIECCSCGSPSGCTCTGCTGRFAAFMGIGTPNSRPSPDPFLETLTPEPTKYCK